MHKNFRELHIISCETTHCANACIGDNLSGGLHVLTRGGAGDDSEPLWARQSASRKRPRTDTYQTEAKCVAPLHLFDHCRAPLDVCRRPLNTCRGVTLGLGATPQAAFKAQV